MDPPPPASTGKTAVVAECLPTSWVREDVENYFSKCGGIERLTYISKKDLALITFGSDLSAEKSVQLNNTTPEGSNQAIKVSYTEKQANIDSSRIGSKKRRNRPNNKVSKTSGQTITVSASTNALKQEEKENPEELTKEDPPATATPTPTPTPTPTTVEKTPTPTKTPPKESDAAAVAEQQKEKRPAEEGPLCDPPTEAVPVLTIKQRTKRQKREKKARMSNLAGSFVDEAF
eukprot:TRINITY_DN3116_c3_g1_i1.p1 TRINITY_DN3116_c3_g1~~TRINITY_DN3116_c3_g1_i1.p1  ORF type:complete len:253 (+),score=86.27 TRINITY_DN3116_c3_g1_i1:64-759(+)